MPSEFPSKYETITINQINGTSSDNRLKDDINSSPCSRSHYEPNSHTDSDRISVPKDVMLQKNYSQHALSGHLSSCFLCEKKRKLLQQEFLLFIKSYQVDPWELLFLQAENFQNQQFHMIQPNAFDFFQTRSSEHGSYFYEEQRCKGLGKQTVNLLQLTEN